MIIRSIMHHLQIRHQVYWRHDPCYRRSWLVAIQIATFATLFLYFAQPLNHPKMTPNAKWMEPSAGEANYQGFMTCMNESAPVRDRGDACDRLLKNSFLSRVDLARAYYGRSLKEDGDGNVAGAILDLSSALEFNPNKVMYFLRGDLYQKQLKFDDAKADYQKALSMDSRFAEPHVGLSRILIRDGNIAAAETELLQAISLKPKLASAHYYLGQLHFLRMNYDGALNSFSAAISNSSVPDAAYLVSRADIYLRQGKLDLARADVERAKTVSPSDSKISEFEPRLLQAEFLRNSKYYQSN